MNFFESIFTCFRKYADFSGRARRSEFFYFALFNVIFYMLLAWLHVLIQREIVFFLCAMTTLLPMLAVTCRRLHDIGKSGFWIFLGLIPYVGEFFLLFMLYNDSEPGTNPYGPNPKAPD